jgi:hypothetical protein
METDLNTVHVFKTNIDKISSAAILSETLDNHLEIQQWSIDYEDIDCVLRIVSETLNPDTIKSIIKRLGYECQDLP